MPLLKYLNASQLVSAAQQEIRRSRHFLDSFKSEINAFEEQRIAVERMRPCGGNLVPSKFRNLLTKKATLPAYSPRNGY